MPKKHVVFIHGFLENAGMWQGIISRLATREYDIHTPELAGHGLRPMLPFLPDITDFAKDIYSQLRLQSGENVIVIGHSMGGYAGIELCKLIGKDVSALCLFHSTATADSEQKKADRLRAIDAAQQNKALYIRTVISSLFDDGKRQKLSEHIEQIIADANAMSVSAITASINAMRQRPAQIGYLQNRHFPLYYFLGTSDTRLPVGDMLQEMEYLKGVVFEITQNTGHMGHVECTEQAAEFIQRIIRADM